MWIVGIYLPLLRILTLSENEASFLPSRFSYPQVHVQSFVPAFVFGLGTTKARLVAFLQCWRAFETS